jgi:hypothetical protein
MPRRRQIWARLASDWKIPRVERIASEVPLPELPAKVSQMLKGQIRGRTVVRVASK